MAGNIEEFIVELGFSDDKAIKGIKEFLGKVDQVNKKVVSRSKQNQEQLVKSTQKNNKATEQGNKLLKAQNELRRKIAQAQKLGMDTSFEERSLARAKKETTIRNRILGIEKKITQEQVRRSKIKPKITSVDKKRDKALEDKRKEEEAAAKRSIRYFNKMAAMFSSASFRQIEQSNPLQAQVFRERRNNIAGMASRISPTDVEGQRKLQRNFEALRHEINMTSDSMRRHTRTMLGVSTVQGGLSDSTRHLIRSYASLFALIEGTTAINRVGQDFQSMEASMLLASGTTQQAAKDLGFVREEALRLGLDLRSATDGFVKLKFAASGKIADDEINQLFVGFNEFARAVGVDKFRTEKGLQAIQQMVNKGQIMAEELKQQLAEQVPGSMKVFEKALGVTSAELFQMMERGELMADEVLPKVGKAFAEMARQGGALEAQIASGRAQQGRFNLIMQEAAKIIFDSGFEKGLSNFFREMVDQTIDAREGIEGLGQIFRWFFDTLSVGAKLLMPLIDGLGFVLGKLFGIVNRISDVFGTQVAGALTSAALAFSALTVATGSFKKSFKLLGAIFSSFLFKVTGITIALDELFSIFDSGRVGLLEKILFGENLDINFEKELMKLANGEQTIYDIGVRLGKALREGIFGELDFDSIFQDMNETKWELWWSELGQSAFNILSNMIATFVETLEYIPMFKLAKSFVESANGQDFSVGFKEVLDNFNRDFDNQQALLSARLRTPTTSYIPSGGNTFSPSIEISVQTNKLDDEGVELLESRISEYVDKTLYGKFEQAAIIGVNN